MKNAYLEALPLKGIAKRQGAGRGDAIPFAGYPRQHPSEKGKLILVHEPLGSSPTVVEFRLDDVLSVEEVPSAVTEAGEGIPLIRLWIRRGARGVILEPFEVDSPVRFSGKAAELRERFLGAAIGAAAGASGGEPKPMRHGP